MKTETVQRVGQRLILPINDCRLTASWKTSAYASRFGFVHYGCDMVSASGNRTVYASGKGEVVAVGRDSVVGKVVVVQYHSALHRIDGRARDVVFRYFHLDTVFVSAGQAVTKDTRLGSYGNTGMLQMARHLHLEADRDVLHPLHSPTVCRSSFLTGTAALVNDRTMSNPLEWLHCKTDSPDLQHFSTAGNQFIRSEDRSLPAIAGKRGIVL